MSETAVATIGHNQGPSTIQFAHDTAQSLSDWMKENPVVETEDQARDAKLLTDRAFNSMKDMEGERKKLVDPLNARITEINDQYREPRRILERIYQELMLRLDNFIKAETAKREAEAALAAAEAEKARQEAIAAAEAEAEAKDSAKHGLIDADILAAVRIADEKEARLARALRATRRAQRATKVKVGGGFRRALALRNQEELIVENPGEALEALGLTDDIREAILKSARAYRKEFGELPDGVVAKVEQGL